MKFFLVHDLTRFRGIGCSTLQIGRSVRAITREQIIQVVGKIPVHFVLVKNRRHPINLGRKKTNTGFSYLHRHSDEPHINDEGWLVRVFANLFPAVSGTEPSRAAAHYPNTDLQISAVGSHEVIVDTRAHSIACLTSRLIQLVYRAIHHRLMTLGAERSIQYISVFKNSVDRQERHLSILTGNCLVQISCRVTSRRHSIECSNMNGITALASSVP